jgi:hypothetical protein
MKKYMDFKHSINPQPVGDVTWTKANHDCIRGKSVRDWKHDGEHFTLKISIPANTTAKIFPLPNRRTM